jgi:O-antigen ligase
VIPQPHIRRDRPRPPAWPPPADAAGLARALDYCRYRDPVGDVLHLALAAIYLFLLPLATTPKDYAFAILLGCAVVRLPHTWSSYSVLVRSPYTWIVIAWSAWHSLSLLWSPRPAAGWDELQAFRVLITPLLVWPILDRAPWLIAALLGGVFATNVVQLGQALEVLGLKPGANGRLPGLIHPIQTGGFCAAAVCWHLSALLTGTARGGRRGQLVAVASAVGGVAATGGLLVSGSRGPWIAAAIAAPLCLAVIAARRRAARRRALVVAAVGLVGSVVAWFAAGDFVEARLEQATADVRAAAAGEYDTDVGNRLARWSAAWAVFVDRPVAGAGGGGYATAARALDRDTTRRAGDHAHSFYMHEMATEGAVGGVLLLIIIALTVVGAARDGPRDPYADGTLFALVSWLVGAQFDCYQLTGTMFGLFAFMMALMLPRLVVRRPAEAPTTELP